MFRLPTALILLAACGVAAACDDRKSLVAPGGATSPTASPVPPPPPAGMVDTRTLEIVSGATRAAVAGATITIGGATYVSDAAGHPADGEQYRPADSDVDVVATGYLRRETRASYGNKIVLWPVADEQEMEAIRRMVYARDGLLRPRQAMDAGPLYVSLFGQGPDTLRRWQGVAAAVANELEVAIEVSPFFQYENNEVGVRTLGEGANLCTPILAWGFCQDPQSQFYEIYWMSPDRINDGAAARRVILSFFLGPNPMGGVMNLDDPGEALSPLELQTIRMILLRPRDNRWPDSDR